MASMASSEPPPRHESVIKGIRHLYKSDWQSDLVIKGGGVEQWKADTVVVCSQSTVFKKAIKPEWQKTQERIIDLGDEPDHLIDQLIRFLYQGSYDDSVCNAPEIPHGPMMFSSKMFIAGDRYDIPGLCEYASQKLLAKMPAADCRNPTLKQDFLNTVYELYQDGPASADKLRGALKVVGLSNSHELFQDDFKKKPAGKENDLTFHKLIRDIPEFGDQIILNLSDAFAEKKENAGGTKT